MLKPVAKQMLALLARFQEAEHLPTLADRTWIFTREEINTLCRFVAKNYYDGVLMRELEKAPGMADAMAAMNDALGAGRVHITEAHENAGLAWLWQSRDRFVAPLGRAEVEKLRRFVGFRLVGVAVKPGGGTHSYLTAPIYQVIGDSGTFSYEAWSWQSGTKPRLI